MRQRRWREGLFLALVLCAMGIVLPSDGMSPPQEEYIFVPDTDRWVCVYRKKWQLIGKLDANGDFIDKYKYSKGAGLSLVPRFTVINHFGQRPRTVYEFRSGSLIKGQMTSIGDFIPEA